MGYACIWDQGEAHRMWRGKAPHERERRDVYRCVCVLLPQLSCACIMQGRVGPCMLLHLLLYAWVGPTRRAMPTRHGHRRRAKQDAGGAPAAMHASCPVWMHAGMGKGHEGGHGMRRHLLWPPQRPSALCPEQGQPAVGHGRRSPGPAPALGPWIAREKQRRCNGLSKTGCSCRPRRRATKQGVGLTAESRFGGRTREPWQRGRVNLKATGPGHLRDVI